MGANLRFKGLSSRCNGNETVKSLFAHIFSSKVDRFTSNQDLNDHRPILHIDNLAVYHTYNLVFRSV